MSRGLSIKQFEFHDNVFSTVQNVICLRETCLNLLPRCYSVFRSDRKSSSNTRGGERLRATNSKFRLF